MRHPLKTGKRQDFEKFRHALLLFERKEHLTEAGLEEIRVLASQMNRGRTKVKSSPGGDVEND
jgi:hypothetical protein